MSLRVVFMGSPAFAAVALRSVIAHHDVCLVVTQPDKRAGRGKRLVSPPVKLVAEEHHIPVVQPPSARTAEFAELLRRQQADVGVVVAYGKILPEAVLQAFPHGCLNIHGSLLPKYRGAAPIQRAVMAGETETGVSIMQLDAGMDTGPVIVTRKMTIGDKETAGMLFERMAPVGASALLEALEQLDGGIATAVAQDDANASYAAPLCKADGLLDWSVPADILVARARGVDPWPGAHVPFGDGMLKLFGLEVCQGDGEPGTFLGVEGEAVVIACGQGACRISEVLPPGRKRVSAAAFARGQRLEPGKPFGTLEQDAS